MLVKIRLSDGGFLYRNITRSNLKKMTKSIHSHFPNSSYPRLEAMIFNALQKEQTVLVLNSVSQPDIILFPPVAQQVEQSPYKA